MAITAITAATTTHAPEIAIPAIASPRPDCLPSLVLTSAMIPKITPSGTQLNNERTSAAIAQRLVVGRGGYGGCGYPAGPG